MIPYDAPRPVLDNIFQNLNGILFTGGGLSLADGTPYFETAKYLYQKALRANNEGDYFPLYGTCMGFQMLHILTANNHSILSSGFDSYNLPLPLEFTDEAFTGKMFNKQSTPQEILEIFAKRPVTMNLHHAGITPADFKANPFVGAFYRVIATNVDKKNRRFISMIEGRNYPVYAAQWHAERNQFEWDLPELLDHSVEAMRAMQWVSNFFVQECRRSNHTFSAELEKTLLIYNFTPTFTGDDPSQSYPDRQVYYFPPSK